jgi:hypothetical protein
VVKDGLAGVDPGLLEEGTGNNVVILIDKLNPQIS